MASITCGHIDCENCGDDNKCKADKVTLSYRNIATVNIGRAEVLVCENYKMSDQYKKLKDMIMETMLFGK